MKITLCIPQGCEDQKQFLRQELAQARNIKDKQTRKTVMNGLSKLI